MENAKRYAIFTFRGDGPLKTWAAVRAAQIHNSREKPIAHAETGVQPRHVIGSGNLVADIKAALRRHGIDPDRLRKNGVIVYEAVLTASPAFFEGEDIHERYAKFGRWFAAQKQFVLEKYGEHRIVSLVLHLDEKTPHLHVVILPLELRADGRSKDAAERWALAGRTVSGPGRFDQLQDEYARAMEPFGLTRGEVKSGRKHKPVRAYLAELKAQEEANAKQAAELQAELARLRDWALRAEVDRRSAHKDRQAAASAKAAWDQARTKVEAERLAIEEDRRLLDRLFDAMGHANRVAMKFMQIVKQFPERRWTPQTLLMSDVASQVTEVSQPEINLLKAHFAQLQRGRGAG